jgi:integrase
MSRKRRGPHVYQRPGRAGFYAYVDRDTKDIALEAADEAQAIAALADLLQRRGVRAPRTASPALSDAFDKSHARSVVNHTKKTAYELFLNQRRLLRWFEARGIQAADEVTKAVVEDYKSERRLSARERAGEDGARRKVSAARVNRELDSLLVGLRQAVEDGAHPSVLEAVEKLREPRRAPHQARLGKGDLRRFLAAVDQRYRPLLRLVLGSAIRDEELRHLRPEWIQVRGGDRHLVVSPGRPGECRCHPDGWTTKSFASRAIPISTQTVKAARAYLAAPPPMDKRWVWEQIQRGCAAARVRPFSLHDLRRAWATGMVDAGTPLQHVSKWLGHADVQTTLRYLGVADERMPAPGMLPW